MQSRICLPLAVSIGLLFSSAARTQGASPEKQGPAQAEPNVSLRATTRLVIVDVVATDTKGQPVTDLRAEDFSMLEDDKAQKVSSFSFRGGKTITRAVQPAIPNTFSNTPQYKDVSSLNVILFDVLNGDLAGHAYGRDELIRYLDSASAIQPTAIYALEDKLTLLSDFTTDTKLLKAAVEDFKPKGATHVESVYAAASPFVARRPDFNNTARTMEITIGGLNSLAQALAGYPGRKNLIWISEGFPLTLYPEILYSDPMGYQRDAPAPNQNTIADSFTPAAQKDFSEEVDKVANALMSAQVAVYPVDASGLTKDNRLNTITTMQSLAERTGGKAFYNRNDVAVGVGAGMDDGSSYYTLEYYPDNRDWNGKFRVIQVKTTRAGTSLRYRQGYYARDPAAADKDIRKTLGQAFSQALSLDAPSSTAVLFQAQVAEKTPKVLVKFAIDPHTLQFSQKNDGQEQASVSCAVAAYTEKGALVKQEITNMTASVKADQFPVLMQSKLGCQQSIELKSGGYNLTLGVVDRNSRLMGTTTAWVQVP